MAILGAHKVGERRRNLSNRSLYVAVVGHVLRPDHGRRDDRTGAGYSRLR